MLEFEHYSAFFCLFLIPLYHILHKFSILQNISFPLTFADWEGKAFQWKHSLFRAASIISKIFLYTAFFCFVIALAGPVISRQEKIFTSRGAEIVFVVDTSPSMAALDMGSVSRLTSAKQIITNAVDLMPGTAFGLIAMASEAVALVSTTEDHALFKSQLESLSIGDLGDGTAIGVGLSSAVYHLASSSSVKKCIVLLTDGENNAGDIHPLTAMKLAAESNISIYSIGVGTTGTVPIEYNDYETGKKYSGFLDSRFDDSLLKTLALETGGMYYKADSAGALSQALIEIVKTQNTAQSYYYERKKDYYFDTFILISALCLCFVWFVKRVYMRVII